MNKNFENDDDFLSLVDKVISTAYYDLDFGRKPHTRKIIGQWVCWLGYKCRQGHITELHRIYGAAYRGLELNKRLQAGVDSHMPIVVK
jgi:hypothetical protein